MQALVPLLSAPQDAVTLPSCITWLRASLGPDLTLGIDLEWKPVSHPAKPQLAVMQVGSSSMRSFLSCGLPWG